MRRLPSIFDDLTEEQWELILPKLSVRQCEVVKLRYGKMDGYVYTLEAIGSIYGVTRERVRSLLKKAETEAAQMLAAT